MQFEIQVTRDLKTEKKSHKDLYLVAVKQISGFRLIYSCFFEDFNLFSYSTIAQGS